MNVNLTGLRKGAVLRQLLCFARDSPATANIAYTLVVFWCRGPESNRYGYLYPTDFKSVASASSATSA